MARAPCGVSSLEPSAWRTCAWLPTLLTTLSLVATSRAVEFLIHLFCMYCSITAKHVGSLEFRISVLVFLGGLGVLGEDSYSSPVCSGSLGSLLGVSWFSSTAVSTSTPVVTRRVTGERTPSEPGTRCRAGRAERTKNGHSARADAGSIDPSGLDRENRDAQTCVRSGQVSRCRLSVIRQWQCRQNTGSCVLLTALRGGCDCPRSLPATACRGLLG